MKSKSSDNFFRYVFRHFKFFQFSTRYFIELFFYSCVQVETGKVLVYFFVYCVISTSLAQLL